MALAGCLIQHLLKQAANEATASGMSTAACHVGSFTGSLARKELQDKQAQAFALALRG